MSHLGLDMSMLSEARGRSRSRSRSRASALSSIVASMTEQENEAGDGQDGGLRRTMLRPLVRKRKAFSLNKLVRGQVQSTVQCLGLRQRADTVDGALVRDKFLVSEYDPGRGGYIACAKSKDYGQTPMHIYDLNHFVGAREDFSNSASPYSPTSAGWPLIATTGRCSDVNARAWVWKGDTDQWDAMQDGSFMQPRYYIADPRGDRLWNPNDKIYRKGISIRFMLYGCRQTATEFDVRVIRIKDPNMCPDYIKSDVAPTYGELHKDETDQKDFVQNWQSLVRPYTINPLLKGQFGPRAKKNWFETVAVKRVRIGEQTADTESVPTAQGSIYVDLNELVSYGWNNKGFNVEEADPYYYDGVPQITEDADATADAPSGAPDIGGNPNFNHRPYYTSRYYLLIRALCPQDVGASTNQDGISGSEWGGFFNAAGMSSNATNYNPSYDLTVKTTFLTFQKNS